MKTYLSIIMVFFVICGIFLSSTAFAQKVYVILADDKGPYAQAEEGFWEIMGQKGYAKSNLSVKTFNLAQNKNIEVSKQIESDQPDLVLALGIHSAKLMRDGSFQIPTVFTMLIHPVQNNIVNHMDNPGGSITGVTLDIGIQDQIEAMVDIQSSIKKIGVIYNPDKNQDFIDRAKTIAQKEGVELLIETIGNDSELSGAFERLVDRKMDILWLIPDSTVFPSDREKRRFAIEYLIKTPTLKNIPVYGAALNFVKSGAVLSLSADFADVGRQAGEMGVKILNGTPPSTMPVEYPRFVKLALNLRTARAIGLDIPDDFIKKADVTID